MTERVCDCCQQRPPLVRQGAVELCALCATDLGAWDASPALASPVPAATPAVAVAAGDVNGADASVGFGEVPSGPSAPPSTAVI